MRVSARLDRRAMVKANFSNFSHIQRSPRNHLYVASIHPLCKLSDMAFMVTRVTKTFGSKGMRQDEGSRIDIQTRLYRVLASA